MFRGEIFVLLGVLLKFCYSFMDESFEYEDAPYKDYRNQQYVTMKIKELGDLKGTIDWTARTNRTIYSFRGIKYAKSPSKELRFKAPVPVKPWDGIRDATKVGILCPQRSTVTRYDNWDIEDCLHLSVYTTNMYCIDNFCKRRTGVPVMIYIHGGSFHYGGASQYPPNYYLEEDIVLVVIQYRLGPLGFLSFQNKEIPGNAGFLDMLLAIKWVNKHINDFGGDKNAVTLVGQGAGAASISLLLQSHLLPTNQVHHAIYQSGGGAASWTIDTNPIENTRTLARYLNCSGKDDIDVVDCMMYAHPKDLVNAFYQYEETIGKLSGINAIGCNRVTIGGPSEFLYRSPLENLRNSHYHDIPIMGGVTKSEGTFILAGLYKKLEEIYDKGSSIQVIEYALKAAGIDDITGTVLGLIEETLFAEAVEHGDFEDLIPGLIDLFGVVLIKAPLFQEMQIRADSNPDETYLYTFNYAGQHSRFGYGAEILQLPFKGGVSHSDENIYLFPWPKSVSSLNKPDAEMSETMLSQCLLRQILTKFPDLNVRLWTSFIRKGEPDCQDLDVHWRPMKYKTGPYLVIGKTSYMDYHFGEEFIAAVEEDYFDDF